MFNFCQTWQSKYKWMNHFWQEQWQFPQFLKKTKLKNVLLFTMSFVWQYNFYHVYNTTGKIIYSFSFPFRHEYQIFQKITKLEYDFPDGFSVVAQDLVEKLLVLDPEQRLGCEEMGGFEKLKSHPFYEGIDFEHIHEQKPPPLIPFLPATSTNPENIWSNYRVC